MCTLFLHFRPHRPRQQNDLAARKEEDAAIGRPWVDPGLPPHEISQTQKDEERMVPYTWNLITFV